MDASSRYVARPTLYRGIQMRSRLEARVAATLDRKDISWEYEPDCFADETGQYLPDFRVWYEASKARTYLEVKPANANVGAIQHRMEIVLATYPDAWLELLACGDFTTRWWLRCPYDDVGWHDLGQWHSALGSYS